MKVECTKTSIMNAESNEVIEYLLKMTSVFCCEKFKEFHKKFNCWLYDNGRFAIVDEISYDSHSLTPIFHCPFCGEEIEYEDTTPSKRKKKKSVIT